MKHKLNAQCAVSESPVVFDVSETAYSDGAKIVTPCVRFLICSFSKST
jgi:hypothetical protein